MISVKVHFGNNNTMNIKVEESLHMASFVDLVANILGLHVLYVIFDGSLVDNLTNPISHYKKALQSEAYVICRTETPAIITSFLQPVPIVLTNPREYLVETTDHYDEQCTYCTMNMSSDEDIVKIVTCQHVFHRECVSQWLSEGDVHCPLCGVDVRTD
jgi:hypothetical protein